MSKEKQIEELARVIGDCSEIRPFNTCDECRNVTGKCCCHIILATKNLAAGYRKQSEWISVDERLPEPNTNVLIYVFFHNQWQIVKGWLSYCDKKFHISNSDYPSLTDVPVTHWMPLPKAPKMKGGAE